MRMAMRFSGDRWLAAMCMMVLLASSSHANDHHPQTDTKTHTFREVLDMEDTRRQRAKAVFEDITQIPAMDPTDPYTTFVLDQVFGEVWTRPALSRRDRRWISMTSVVSTANADAIAVHMRSALNSGDITLEELQEFVLHYAIYNGMPKAVNAHAAVTAIDAARGQQTESQYTADL